MAAPTPPPGFKLEERPPLPPGFAFDDALAVRQSQMRPGGQLGVRTGEELVPGQGLPGAPNYQPPMIAPAPQAAPASNFGAALKSKLVEDEGTKVRLVAESLGIDPARVGIVEGRPVYVNDEGKLQFVSGPVSRGAAGIIANTPEMALGGLGSVSGSPIIGGTLGAVGGRGIKRALAGLVTGEPQTISGNLADLAMEGGISALSAGAGKGLVGFAGRNKIVDFTPAQIKTAEQSRAYIKAKTGIDLDLAQASGDRKLLAMRDYAATYPGKSAEMIQASDEAAQGQLDAATNRVIDLIANAKPAELSGQNAINAADQTIYATRRAVYERVRPLYDAAYAAVPEVTDQNIIGMLKLPYFKAAFEKGQKIAKLEGAAIEKRTKTEFSQREEWTREGRTMVPVIREVDVTKPDLRSLDYTKRALDDNIEALKSAGKRQEARALKMKRDEFVASIDALPNQAWQLARQRYGELIEAQVAPLENGMVGVLAKMHPKNAHQAARIFSDPSITPEQIAVLKGGLARSNPESYRGLVRQWLAQKWDEAQTITQGGDTINPAGKFLQSVMKNPRQRDVVKAMLPADASQALEDVMLAAEKLARTPLGASRIAGSPTAPRQLITEQLKGRALGAIKWLMFPRQSIREAAEQRVLESGVEELTEALIDPMKRAQLKQITRMKPSEAQAIRLGTFLSGQGVKIATEDMYETRMPQAPYQ